MNDLYLFLIIAFVILAPIVALLWYRYSPKLVYVTDDLHESEESPAVYRSHRESATPHVQERSIDHAQASPENPPIKLAPLPYIARNLLQDAPHIGIIGQSGSGKTTTGEALLRLLDGEGYVLDPKWWVGKWGGLPASGIDDEGGYSHLETGIQTLWYEFRRRIVTKRDNPQARFPHLWIVWDEINDVMEESKDAGMYLRRWLRLGREYNIHILFFPQSDRVKALGLDGHGDAVKNVLWLYLGDDAREVVKSLLKEKKITPEIASYMIDLERPAIVKYAGRPYAVDLSESVELSEQPLQSLGGWAVPVPGSDPLEITDSTQGTREPDQSGNQEATLDEIQEAAILWWLSQGETATAIAGKLGVRKQTGLAKVREVKEKLEDIQKNSLHSEPAKAA